MTSGHNSVAADKLRSLVERIERLDQEKRDLSEDIRDIYKEAKSAGYDTKALRALIADTKALRALIAERAKDADAVAEH